MQSGALGGGLRSLKEATRRSRRTYEVSKPQDSRFPYLPGIDALRAPAVELFPINGYAPVSWVEESNHALAEAARDWPHTTLIDWKPVAESHQDLLWDEAAPRANPAGAR